MEMSLKLVVDERDDVLSVERIKGCEPLAVGEGSRVVALGRAHDHSARMRELVERAADEPTVDVVRDDDLNASMEVANRPRRKVGDIGHIAAVSAPVVDDLLGARYANERHSGSSAGRQPSRRCKGEQHAEEHDRMTRPVPTPCRHWSIAIAGASEIRWALRGHPLWPTLPADR